MKSEFLRKNNFIVIGLGIVIIIISTSVGILFSIFSNSKLHPPIIIESDDDFLIYNFPRNGTQDNPYIIEDFRIGAFNINGFVYN